MIKTAIEFLMNAGKNEIIDVNGQKYSTKSINRVMLPQVHDIDVSTLTGLVDYIKSNIDKIQTDLLIQVANPTTVHVYSPLKGDLTRDHFIECNAVTPRISFDSFLDVEKFNIMLQSCFLENEDRVNLLKVIGNIKEENVKNTGDDGITQTVTAKSGISLLHDIKVPNPVTLIPFMTFTEIEQPEIKYVFRMQDGPRAGIYEADGGAWKLQTMQNIKKFLQKELEGCNVNIIA